MCKQRVEAIPVELIDVEILPDFGSRVIGMHPSLVDEQGAVAYVSNEFAYLLVIVAQCVSVNGILVFYSC